MTAQTTTAELTLSQASAIAQAYEVALAARYLDRGAEIHSLLVAAVAGEHVLLLGPPGVAKSQLAFDFAAGQGWQSFYRLLGRQTVPEELFGPWDLSGLTESPSRFERVISGYMPTAQLAVLDEIFKGSTAILNSLLTIINERVLDQGAARIRVPLQMVVGLSNELPQDDGLGALYDRFLMRHWVDYLRSEDDFTALLLLGPPAPPPVLDPRVLPVLSAAAATIDTAWAVPAVVSIRAKLSEEHVNASDRRWRRAMGLVRASAALAGRTQANKRDLAVLADCLWDRPDQRELVRAVVAKQRDPELAEAEELLAALREEAGKIPPESRRLSTAEQTQLATSVAEMKRITETAERRLNGDPKADPPAPAASDPEVRAALEIVIRESNDQRRKLSKRLTGSVSA